MVEVDGDGHQVISLAKVAACRSYSTTFIVTREIDITATLIISAISWWLEHSEDPIFVSPRRGNSVRQQVITRPRRSRHHPTNTHVTTSSLDHPLYRGSGDA